MCVCVIVFFFFLGGGGGGLLKQIVVKVPHKILPSMALLLPEESPKRVPKAQG